MAFGYEPHVRTLTLPHDFVVLSRSKCHPSGYLWSVENPMGSLLLLPPSPNTKYKLMFVEEKFLKEEKGSARFSSFMNFS